MNSSNIEGIISNGENGLCSLKLLLKNIKLAKPCSLRLYKVNVQKVKF